MHVASSALHTPAAYAQCENPDIFLGSFSLGFTFQGLEFPPSLALAACVSCMGRCPLPRVPFNGLSHCNQNFSCRARYGPLHLKVRR